MSNSKALATNGKPKFSVAINTDTYQKLIRNTLGDPERSKRFIASISSAVAVNPQLQQCDAGSILSGALLGESLNLNPSPQLGQYYLVPFGETVKQNGQIVYKTDKDGNFLKDNRGRKIPEKIYKAQFIPGYKGYMQLAMNSGQLKKLNAVEIKDGELKHYDPLNEEIKVELIEDWDERQAAETIGYYAFFELINGFRKAMYWSKKKMLSHADQYSSAFSREVYEKIQRGEIPESDMWRYSSFWYKNFDEMARKTMIRQLISKGGCPMSTEMQTLYERDSTVNAINDKNEIVIEAAEQPDYVEDNTPAAPVQELGEPADEGSISPDDIKPEADNAVQKIDLAKI